MRLRSNRSREIVCLTVFLTVVGLQPGTGYSQVDRHEIEPALSGTEKELRPQFGAVRFHRLERLEDKFLILGTASVAQLAPHFFEVQPRRFDLSSGHAIEITPPSIPTMYVATSANETRVYKLGGFGSAEQEFKRLLNDSPPQLIRTTRDAESRGLLCAEIVYGLSPAWWIDGESSAKLNAARHFFDEGHKNGFDLTKKWWKSFTGKSGAIEIQTKKTTDGFAVNLPVFWAPVESQVVPEIRVYRIDVSSGGYCHLNEPIVYK